MSDQETIIFDIWIGAEFWDKPASIEVSLDNEVKFASTLFLPGVQKFSFSATLDFVSQHRLTIKRFGKTIDQTKVINGVLQDQIVWLEKLLIDGIDVQHLVHSSSLYFPEFPEPWASEQIKEGIELEYPVISGTHWGHNGVWQLDFTSPFYKFLLNSMP